MKEGIHPEYKVSTVTCVCGSTFTTRSTVGDLKLEICSECHPFFTGRQKLIDTAGRIDKFNQRFEKSRSIRASKKSDAAPQEESAETSTEATAE